MGFIRIPACKPEPCRPASALAYVALVPSSNLQVKNDRFRYRAHLVPCGAIQAADGLEVSRGSCDRVDDSTLLESTVARQRKMRQALRGKGVTVTERTVNYASCERANRAQSPETGQETGRDACGFITNTL